MENKKKKIYPFQFEAQTDEYAWGKETWMLADLGFKDSNISNGWLAGNTLSDVMETYLERIVGEEVYSFYGRQFPVSLKKLEIKGNYGLYVCPDDVVAEERYDALGKKKLWYVLEAGEDAEIYLGLEHDLPAIKLYENCKDGSILNDVKRIHPEVGAHYEIEPGQIHGASGHLTLVEVAESSNMDLKLYDWGENPESCEEDLVSAIDFVELGKYCFHEEEEEEECCCGHEHHHDHEEECCCGHDAVTKMTEILIEGAEFTTTGIKLSDPVHIYTDKFSSFILYYCVKGEAAFQVRAEETDEDKDIINAPTDFYVLEKGKALLIPGESPDFILAPREADTYLLETVLDHREIPDEYINPGKEEDIEVEDDEEEENNPFLN